MKLVRAALRSFNHSISCQSQPLKAARSLSTSVSGARRNQNSDFPETTDEFERRIFGDSLGKEHRPDTFYRNTDRGQGRSVFGKAGGQGSEWIDGFGDGIDSLSDGMNEELKEAAEFFEVNCEEFEDEDYSFRPDVNFAPGETYSPKDLDLTKPGVWVPTEKQEFQVTTKDVLEKADFRNVPFLVNFITESGIIFKRSMTGISAKAQRKIAREIKTARAFGLMPFTTMGKRSFEFGKTMESLDRDYKYETIVDDFEE